MSSSSAITAGPAFNPLDFALVGEAAFAGLAVVDLGRPRGAAFSIGCLASYSSFGGTFSLILILVIPETSWSTSLFFNSSFSDNGNIFTSCEDCVGPGWPRLFGTTELTGFFLTALGFAISGRAIAEALALLATGGSRTG